MADAFKYPLTGIVILLLLVYIIPACDGILAGLLEEGEPVQVHLVLADASETYGEHSEKPFTSPVIEEVTFSISDIVIKGNKTASSTGNTRFFVIPDSVVTLFPGDSGRMVSEKVIPEGNYSHLQLLFNRPDSDEGQASLELGSISVMGSTGQEEFEYTLRDSIELDLPIHPALRVGTFRDSLTIVSVSFDYSTWFVDKDGGVLDPADPNLHQQISENIRNSVVLSIKSIRRDREDFRRNSHLGFRGDVSAEEGSDSLKFSVSLSETSVDTVRVDFATSDNSAKAGKDYTATSGTLVFLPGETEQVIAVELLDDNAREGEEKFTLLLSNPEYADLNSKSRRARGIIIDNDGQ